MVTALFVLCRIYDIGHVEPPWSWLVWTIFMDFGLFQQLRATIRGAIIEASSRNSRYDGQELDELDEKLDREEAARAALLNMSRAIPHEEKK